MKKKRITLTERWLWLGVAALAVAGLYALVPVIGRTPQLKNLNIVQHLFDIALVIHVDLSVLIWFLSFICMGAAWLMERHARKWLYWREAGFLCVAAATLLMAFSPLGAWVPVKSNYIPVLHNLMFHASLGLLMVGLILSLLPCALTYLRPKYYRTLKPIALVCFSATIAALFALVGYVVGAWKLPVGLELTEHYERLFWLGGHMMQFAYVLLVMSAWLLLLHRVGGKLPSRRVVGAICAITLMGSVASLVGDLLLPVDAGEGMYFQTRIMIEWGGVGATLMAFYVVWRLGALCNSPLEGRAKEKRTYAACLIVSLILFFFGGVLGLMISGQNVTIPAHYHGMITGITQALMGLAYAMLPRFGYRPVAATRLAFWQPIIYGLGQLMHIGGLAYCGGYGILRKTAGGFEHLAPDIKVALGIFGLGGLLAITGGILFVIVMLRATKSRLPIIAKKV